MEIEEDGIKSDVLTSQVVVVAASTTTTATTAVSGEAVVFETVDSGDQDLSAGDNQRRSSHRGSAKSHQISVAKRPVGFNSHHPYNAQCTSPTKMLGGGGGRNNRRRSLPTAPMSASLPSLARTAGEDWNNHQQQAKHNRRMRRHQNKMGKRLRRLVQMAPNNNNEFLMQEHDHLYHLDDDDSNSDEQNAGGGDAQQQRGQNRLRAHRYSSSPEEDEEDYLARDFSNTYDVVHAERLFNMSKNELIQEYQLMEERVELLENKLRTALLERRSRGEEEDPEDAEMVPVQETRNTSPKSESIPVPNSSPRYYDHQDSGILSGSLSDSDILISSSTGSSCSSNTCTSASSQLSSRRSSAQDRNYDDEDDDEVEDV